MNHSEEILSRLIRNKKKNTGQCTRSNKIKGGFGQIYREQTLCRSYNPLQHAGYISLILT